MASFVYDVAREKFLTGDISWTRDDIKVAILKSIPHPSIPNQKIKYIGNEDAQENHRSLQQLPISNLVSISGIIYNKSFSKGIAGGDAVIFNDIEQGVELTSVIIYKRGLSNDTSFLIAHLDTQLITDSSRQVTIQWNVINGQSWIFRI